MLKFEEICCSARHLVLGQKGRLFRLHRNGQTITHALSRNKAHSHFQRHLPENRIVRQEWANDNSGPGPRESHLSDNLSPKWGLLPCPTQPRQAARQSSPTFGGTSVSLRSRSVHSSRSSSLQDAIRCRNVAPLACIAASIRRRPSAVSDRTTPRPSEGSVDVLTNFILVHQSLLARQGSLSCFPAPN